MKFQTPQFIEIEDKIFGPLTLKQFIYLAGSAGISFALWRFLPIFLAILLILPIAGFGLALAFYKINRKPFIFTVEAAVKYFLNPKLFIWRKETKPVKNKSVQEAKKTVPDLLSVPRLSESKLKDLSWSLDVHDLRERKERGIK